MDSPALVGPGGAASLSPTSPVSIRSIGAANGGLKRKRSAGGVVSAIDSSPGSIGDENDIGDHHDRKRQPGVKRACNECRQQKLRCDVVQEPFQSCSRCNRLKLDCKIESNFKRVGKRSKHAEMEKEIDKLRRAVHNAKAQGFVFEEPEDDGHSQLQSPVVNSVYSHTRNPSLMGSDEAVSSLLHLKRGGSYAMPRIARELEDIRLTEEAEHQLFEEFFTYYHPFLPFLNPSHTPDQYYQQLSLLYWSIISVAARRYAADPTFLTQLSGPLTRLLWQTIGDVPQSYYAVKAMCLLCTWPLPTSTSASDPTHILGGVMMKTATGIGLHRPNHINDFSRVALDLNTEQLHDRVKTWAVCNIVAQTIGTGYGQPASTLYDWTLAVRPGDSGPLALTPELEARLQIERFCDKVSKEMYSNASDPRGVAGDEHRAMLMRVYRREFGELQSSIVSQNLPPFVILHLRAAGLHLRLAGFFDASTTPGYMDDLMGLWRATVSFLDYILDGDSKYGDGRIGGEYFLTYATNYIQQMLVAAGFALLKLLRSFFAKSIDFDRGRTLFHRTVQAIRTTSVVQNDLNWRLAELMVQIWNGARMDNSSRGSFHGDDNGDIDDSLQLKVRCRHSMSLVFDSIWHWREEYQARGRGTLDALKQPTNPDSANESSASSTHLDSTLMPPSHNLQSNLNIATSNGAITPSATSGLAGAGQGNSVLGMNYENSYDVWDPQHWMLDGLLDFNYAFVPPLEGS
ncbi:N-terminal fungal transcription regulatory domain-containing protein [Coniochaeta ligniaria NRRL 30616]|uniref:N-terminal fungal transcription regulatory domain-containing protein n=1 Tax=Coniochaeta ligniaria NRRL 30616 TaxID=1408157 RepID=A0A1J7IFL5_9PEZI|nr:N-terminal fungal transcription regulatory domain-containing protein [Coniochaeta ligniaria NRRL 30616]